MPELRVVSDEIDFPEGPLELPNGDILITEVRQGLLARFTPEGKRSTFAELGGGPVGAAIGPEGAIFVTQTGGGVLTPQTMPAQIQRVSADGSEVTTLYTECEGEPLKLPNDLVFDAEGNFYFTDTGRVNGRMRQMAGVFYATSDGKLIREIAYPMEWANGCSLSPDGRTLYVAETSTGRVWALELAGPGQVKSQRLLATVPSAVPGVPARCDSMCVDAEGNVLQATLGHGGVTSIAPDGTCTHYPVPDPFVTNCCFGGPGLRTLYVTGSSTGTLFAFDNWPTAGLELQYQS